MITHIQIRRACHDWLEPRSIGGSLRRCKKNPCFYWRWGNAPRTETLTALQGALESQGIEFLPGNGIRPKEEIITVYEGADAEEQLLNDIYQTMVASDEGVAEKFWSTDLMKFLRKTIPRLMVLQRHNLKDWWKQELKNVLLAARGIKIRIAPWHYYRWVPAKENFKTPFFIYGSKIAL